MLLVAVLAIVIIAGSATAVSAAPRMPVGFYDDYSFRWSPDVAKNLLAAQKAGASVIHVTADWSQIAAKQPANPANGDDPAYLIADLDNLVDAAPRYGLQVMINISGAPKWANGNQTPNHPPTDLSTLTTFAHMLARRYNGYGTHGLVDRWSIWNEPNLGLFLTPQFSGTKIVSPAEYLKIYLAAYQGIKSGNPQAMVAVGETSNRGRNKPLVPDVPRHGRARDLRAHALAARPASSVRRLGDAPVSDRSDPRPDGKRGLPERDADEAQPVRCLAPEVVPPAACRSGSPSTASRRSPRTRCWASPTPSRREMPRRRSSWPPPARTSRCSSGSRSATARRPGRAGSNAATGSRSRPTRRSPRLRRRSSGQTVRVTPGKNPTFKVYVPFMAYHDPRGTKLHIKITIYQNGKKINANQQENQPLAVDQSVTVALKFMPQRGKQYTVIANVNDIHAQHDQRTIFLETT